MKTGMKWQLKITVAICIAIAVPSQSQTSKRVSEIVGSGPFDRKAEQAQLAALPSQTVPDSAQQQSPQTGSSTGETKGELAVKTESADQPGTNSGATPPASTRQHEDHGIPLCEKVVEMRTANIWICISDVDHFLLLPV